jgi:hypothetical protein
LAVAEGILVGACMLVALVQGPTRAGSVDSAQFLTLHGLPIVALCWMAIAIWYRVMLYRRIDSFQYRDASANPETPAPKFDAQGRDLFGIGFRPFGEMEVRFPWQDWQHSWVLVDGPGYVSALIGLSPSPALSTGWPDGPFVVTMARRAQAVRTARGWMTTVAPGTPSQELYRRHLAEAYAFGTGRPEPVRATTMTAYLASSAATIQPTREAMRAAYFRPSVALSYFAVIFVLVILALFST